MNKCSNRTNTKGAPQVLAYTHLVRGGSVMLQLTRHLRVPSISSYPPRQRWVRDVTAYKIGNEG